MSNSQMELFIKEYYNSNSSKLLTKTYEGKHYYIIVAADKKMFDDDILTEEIPFLKAQVKQILFEHFKKRYSQMKTLELSHLIHGKSWESKGYFHHIAQIERKNITPVPKSTIHSHKPMDNNISSSDDNNITHKKLDKTIVGDTSFKSEQKKRIEYLEKKLEYHPKNTKVLNELRSLYRSIGDIEKYEYINNRIIDAKMDI